MASSAVDICSAALVLVGANPITSFSDESNEAVVSNLFYGTLRDNLLSSYPWRFCLGAVELAQLTNTPIDTRWAYAYQLPTDCLLVREAPKGLDYAIFENKLYANADSVAIVYQFRVEEGRFPVYFELGLKYELAKLFASALVEDGSKMDRFTALANGQAKLARHMDSQQYPPVVLDESCFAITAVRRSG